MSRWQGNQVGLIAVESLRSCLAALWGAPQRFFRYFSTLLLVLSVSACHQACQSSAEKDNNLSVNLLIWGEYTSQQIFDDFFAETGIRVNESNFSSNEELLAKIQTGADGYDLIIPSDYMVSVMSSLGLLQVLDDSLIPNKANIEPNLLSKRYDPENRWSLPYSWSITGITVNRDKVKQNVEGFTDLFESTRKDLRLRYSILDDNREVFSAVLKTLGKSVNTTDPYELAAARDLLVRIKRNVREFTSTPTASLESGDFIAAQMFSNESLRLMSRNPSFEFILPKEGFVLAIDNFAIPKSASHSKEAHALINFLLDRKRNIAFASELLTAPVVAGAAKELPENIRSHPAISSFDYAMKHGEMLTDVGDAIRVYDRMWTELKVSEP